MDNKKGIRMKLSPGKPRLSMVWQYFDIDPLDKEKVTCRVCQERLKFSGSTTSMKYHLRRHASALSLDIPLPPSKLKLKKGNRSGKSVSESRHDVLTANLVSLVARDYLHPTIVEGDGFRALIRFLEPTFSVPSAQALTRRMSLMYEVYKYRLATELPNISEVALGIERWMSAHDITYMTITVYYVNAAWEFQGRVLGTEPIHDKLDDFADCILRMCKSYSVQENMVVAAVHENDQDVQLSCALLGWHHFPCFARTLSNCVNGALAIADVAVMVATCRNIVNCVLANSSLANVFEEHQKSLGLPRRRIVVDFEGHWPSTWKMLDFAQEQCQALILTFQETIIPDVSVAVPIPSEEEWLDIKAVVDALRPLDTVREMLRCESHVSLSTVVPILFSLVSVHLQPQPADKEIVSNLKKMMINDMKAQFSFDSAAFTESFGIMATVLDPRHKSLPFLNEIQRNIVKTKLVTLVEENRAAQLVVVDAQQLDSSTAVDEDNDGEEKRPKPTVAEFLSSIYDCVGGNTNAPMVNDTKSEVEKYLQEDSAPLNSNPLSWWKVNYTKYPILSKLARRMLCIPATAVRPSQAFAASQHTTSIQRAALDPMMVDKLVFLNGNLQNGIMSIDNETQLLKKLAAVAQSNVEVSITEQIEDME